MGTKCSIELLVHFKILSRIVMKFCEEHWFVEIFKMVEGFCLKWTGIIL